MKNKIFKNWLQKIGIIIVLLFTFSFVNVVYAQECTTSADCTGGEFCNANEICVSINLEGGGTGLSIPNQGSQISSDIVQDRTFGDLVLDIVNYFIGFLGFLATIVFVYSGVLWVTSGGAEERIAKAKKIMTYAALGLIIVILSFSIVQFITSSAGGEKASYCDPPCSSGEACIDNPDTPAIDYSCVELDTSTNICGSSFECPPGQYCSLASNSCISGIDLTCDSNENCDPPKICDEYGLCRNPNANSGSYCSDNTDCPPNHGFVCNLETNICEMGGTDFGGDSVDGGDSEGSADDILNNMDNSVDDLIDLLENINEDIESLPDDIKDNVIDTLGKGMLEDKMAGIKELMMSSNDPAVLAVLARILEALEKLEDLRRELNALREVMPESEKTIKAWDDTSETLDDLIDDPRSSVKLRRFERNYRDLSELIRKFPKVISSIHAAPGQGNVPFTVTLDGLNSIDPSGGTISDYKWSYLDNSGSQVSLGNSPVIIHEFTEPNTYSVRLQVSTSKMDSSGYKTAMDGVSTVRIRANPPASQVSFRINGVEAHDVYHITLKEAKSGLAFDPASTLPAIGKSIVKYEWLYGDTISEQRSTPSTVVHSYDKSGEYYVTLKVTDNQGTVDKRIVKLFVKSLAANIETVPGEGNVNTEFHFKGINSRSDDGAIKSYEWEIEDLSGQKVAESEEENFYHKFDRPGDYNVTLLITDITGAKDRHVGTLNIFSRPPVASFAYDIPETNHPNRVEFNAINSYDPDQGDHITYSWDFDGDGDFDIVDTNEITVTHEYKKVGEYRVTLQVQDSFEQRKQIEKGISIQSVLSGDIVLSTRAAQVGEEVEFESKSPNAIAYLWEFGDGQTTSTEETKVTYTYDKKGKYKVKLNFFDKDDNDNADYSYLLIGDQDSPIAAADVLVNSRSRGFIDDLCGPDKHGLIVTRADNLLLTARNSINRDGSSRLLSYNWRISGGIRSDRKEFTHRFDEINRGDECFEASLSVRDQVSGKVSNEDIIYLKVVNQIPTIVDLSIAGEKEGVELISPTKVSLHVITPKDKDGQVKKYRWWYFREGYEDQKLGIHSTNSSETDMTITAEGQPDIINKYYFVVEITDNDGGVYNSFERFGELSSLEIKNGPNFSPVAEFTVDKTTISMSDSITFVSKSYDPQGDDLPGDAFRWDFDGDGEYDDITSGPQVNRQFNTPGEYEVRLKVVHRGLSSSTTKTIFVEQVDSLPQAAFIYEIDGDTVTFDAGNSRYDPDLIDTTLRFEWDFNIKDDDNGNGINDDDVQSTEQTPSFTYVESGIYRVRLKIKDSLGMEGVVVRDIDLGVSAADRKKNSYYSAQVSSPNQPLTTLNIIISPKDVAKGGTADIKVSVQNADNSPYYGQVFFEVVEGSGSFTPNPVDAKDSKAAAIFTSVDSGSVRIKVRATDTYYGEVVEEAAIRVK